MFSRKERRWLGQDLIRDVESYFNDEKVISRVSMVIALLLNEIAQAITKPVHPIEYQLFRFSPYLILSCFLLMIRSFTKNHKVLTTCVATTAVGSLFLLKPENRYLFASSGLTTRLKVRDSTERVTRTTYFLGNAASIVFDYWYSFRKLERGTPGI